MATPNRYYSSTALRTQLTASVASTATVLTVASTSGFPDSTPFTLLLDAGTVSEEIVTVTGLAGTSLTVIRGEDGTAGAAHNIGCDVQHSATARDFREPQQHMVASANVHGVTSNVVGVNDPQTLRNKTFDASNVFPATPKTLLPADTVYTTATQTLTGKTISGASNTLTNIPKSALPGDIYYGTTTALPAAALAHYGAALTTVSTPTRTVWGSGDVVSDPSGSWSAANPTRLTAKATGVYLVTITTGASQTSSGSGNLSLYKNGTLIAQAATGVGFTGTGTIFISSVGALCFPVALTVGDYVEANLVPQATSAPFVYTMILQQIG